MGHIDRIKVGSATHLIEPTLYAKCETAAGTATKQTAAINNFSLVAGVQVAVKFTVTNTAAVSNLKLQVGTDTTTAKSIKYRGGNLPSVGTLTANHIYNFVYDGTNWELVGDLDTNTQSAYGNISTSGTLGTASQAVVTDSNKKITTADLSVSDDTTIGTTATSFVAKVTQSAQGKITVTKANLPTASTSVAGITKVGASGGAAAYSHNHDGVYAPVVNGGYLPLSGGTMTGAINTYHPTDSTTTTTPVITLRTNNKDVFLFQVGHATSVTGGFSNNYRLKYNGSLNTPNNYLELLANNGSGDTIAIQVNETGIVKFPGTFNYTGITTGDTAIARPIWFGAAIDSNTLDTGRPVYDSDFKYNPNSNTLTIGTGTLTATNYSGKAATAGTADSANAVAWGNVSNKPTKITLTGSVTGSVSLGNGELTLATTTNHNHDTAYVKKVGDLMSGKLWISSTSESLNTLTSTSEPRATGTLLEVRHTTDSSSDIEWPVSIKNVFNQQAATPEWSTGIKLALGGGTETEKWVGIRAVNVGAYANTTVMDFYANETRAMRMADTWLAPGVSESMTLGTSSQIWKSLYAKDAIINGSIYFGPITAGTSKAVLVYDTNNTKHGIWYYNDAKDRLMMSASGNADSFTTADFTVEQGGLLYNKGNIIPNTGNSTGNVGSTTQTVYIDGGIIKAGTTLGTAATHAHGDYALAGHDHNSTYLKLDGSNNMSNDIGIIFGDTDKFLHFKYSTDTLIDNSWRTGVLGSGRGDSNYYVIQSGGVNNSTSGAWVTALQIGQQTYNVGFAGNVYPISTTSSKTLGTSNNKWSAVYATNLYGTLSPTDLEGVVTTTAKKFLKDTGDWAQVDWGDLTGVPNSFTPSSHTHDYLNSKGNVTAETEGNKPAQKGLSMRNAYNNGYPTSYGNVLTMYGAGATQLFMGWSGSSNSTTGVHADAYIRSQRDTDGSLWSSWAKLLDSDNYKTYTVSSIAGLQGDVTLAQLGLSSALRYQGTTTTAMEDGRTTAAVTIGGNSFTPTQGDVVIYNDAEYVWTGSLWELLGAESSFKKVQTAVNSSSASGNSATTFVSSVTQDTQGVITVKTSTLDTSGTWSGNATSATTATYLGNIGRLANMDVNFGSTAYNSKFFISYADGSTTTNKPYQNAMVLNIAWDNVSSNKYGAQIAIGNSSTPHLQLRGCYNGTWDTTWATVLDSSNYTTYAVAKTDGVTAVTWDATNKKLTRTINGTAADVMTATQMSTALGLGTMASETATNYLKWQTTSSASTALYNFGVYVAQNTAAGTGPNSSNYYNLINVPYRKASGNTKLDWGWQLGNTTSNDNRLYYRTTGDNTAGAWQTIVHVTTSANSTGSALQPVYINANGEATACTFKSLGDSNPNNFYSSTMTYTNSTAPTTDWYVQIELNRTWDGNLTNVVLKANYSNHISTIYLNLNAHDGEWDCEHAVYGGATIKAIKAFMAGTELSRHLLIQACLAAPTAYNGSIPPGTITVYAPVDIVSITKLDTAPTDLITLRRGYNTTMNVIADKLYGTLEGNATTATSSKVLANLYGNYGIGQSSADRPDTANIAHVTNGGVTHFKVTSKTNATGKPMGNGNILHFHWDTSAAWDSQLYIPCDNADTSMQWRDSSAAGTWDSWRTLLDSDNYSSYGIYSTNLVSSADLTNTIGTINTRWGGIHSGYLQLSGPASDPSGSAGARIIFSYDGSATSHTSQPVVLAYTPNDSYRAPYGLKLFGTDGNGAGAWFETTGDIISGKNLTVNGISTLNGNTTISAATPVLQVKSTGTNAATLGLIRNGLSSWQLINSGGNLYLQNNWDGTSGKAVNYFNVVTYGHTYGTVEIHKNLAVGGTSTFSDEATLTKANGGANFGIYVNHTNPNSDTSKAKKIGLMVGGATGSGGVYDVTKGKWIVYSDTDGDVTLNGNALTATNVAWSGITSNPISFISTAYGTTGWKQLGGRASNNNVIVISKPTDVVAWGTIAHSAVISFGCNDTKGMLDISYNSPLISIAGGSNGQSTDSAPKWYFKLSGTSGKTYTFPSDTKTLAAADGSNASGTEWAISITGSSASCTGNAATAAAIQTAGTTAQFYRGDNSWSNTIKQTANAALGIDTNLKIGTARKDLNFDIAIGTGTGINDGYAGGITWGTGAAAHAGIYCQTSGSYGTRLIFGTTGSYANGAYARMIIQNNGNVGIGTLSPDALLTVKGNGKFTGQIITSFKNSIAPGSYCSAQTTIPDLLEEVRYSSGCMGSFNLTTAYTLNNVTLAAGWYNFMYIPHRNGGLNGAAQGDNCDYGALYLHRMNAAGYADYVLAYSSGAAKLLDLHASFQSAVTDGEIVVADGTLGHIKTSGYTVSNFATSDHNHDEVYAPVVTGGYLPKSGGTMTGALNFANNTWNLVGDDVYLGDINKGGHLGIQGKNGNTGIFFTTYNQTNKLTGGAITWDGTKFSITSTTAVDASISGNAATASKLNTNELTDQDLNNYKDDNTTWYFAGGGNSVTNKPTGVTSFGLYVYKNASGYRAQELYSSQGSKWMRYWNNGAWTEWEQMYGTLHKPTAADIGAAPAVTGGYLPLSGGTMSGHIFMGGSNASSSTANTTQLVFGTSTTQHIAITSNDKALILNPSTGSTTNQIILYLNKKSKFPSGIEGDLTGNATSASKISAKLAATTKTYLLGTATAITATAANVDITGDTGVYLTTTAGELSAARHSWNVSGTEKAYTTYNSTDDSIDFVFI